MRKFLLISIVVFAGRPTLAQSFRVLEVKEGQVVVEPVEDFDPQVGQIYQIKSGKEKTVTKLLDPPRDQLLALSGDFASIFNNNNGNNNTYTLSSRLGWNTGWITYGPQISYSQTKKDSLTTITYDLGLFFDWNFIRNRPRVAENNPSRIARSSMAL